MLRSAFTTLTLAFLALSPLRAQIATQADRTEALSLFRIGQQSLTAEQFEKAIEAFSKALQKDPLLSIAHYGIGQANMNLRRYASAVRAYTNCIEAMRTVHRLQQAGDFAADKQRDDEIRELREIVNHPGHLDRLKLLQAQQHLRDLENQRHQTSEAFRPPAETLLALGSAQFRDGDVQGAEVNWKAAVEVNPKYGEAHNNLAVIYMQTGRFTEADAEIRLAEQNGFRVNPQFKADLKDRQKAAAGR